MKMLSSITTLTFINLVSSRADNCDNSNVRRVSQDILTNQGGEITCRNGCIIITKAMYACGVDDMKNLDKHTNFLNQHCSDKDVCTFVACDEFFDTDPGCVDKAPILWIGYEYFLF